MESCAAAQDCLALPRRQSHARHLLAVGLFGTAHHDTTG